MELYLTIVGVVRGKGLNQNKIIMITKITKKEEGIYEITRERKETVQLKRLEDDLMSLEMELGDFDKMKAETQKRIDELKAEIKTIKETK